MKTLKKYTASAALGLALISSTNAATIYIAGSNGDRVVTQTAISNVLTGATFQGVNADPTKANFGIWTGKYKGNDTKVKVAFIGATGGIAAVAGGKTVKFSSDATPTKDPTVVGNQSEDHIPDFSTSTNFQTTSPFQGSFQGTVYETLKDQIIGVVPLKFLASPGFPASNITTQQAQLLYLTGKVPVSIFTGKPADRNKTVFAIGRNTDAGQRFGTLAEIGLGYNAVVKHYLPTITGAKPNKDGVNVGGTVTKQELWPIETVSGVSSVTLGNSGYSSGARLAPALTVTLSKDAYKVGNAKAKAGYYIGYLTFADAKNIAKPAGAKELSYNGVSYTPVNLRDGLYTFWLYTHILYKKSLSGTARNLADTLATRIKNNDAEAQGSGVFLSSLQVKRTSDGGVVTPIFF